MGIAGPIPDWMFNTGKLINDYFSKEKLLYIEVNESLINTENNTNNISKSRDNAKKIGKKMHILIPKRTSLKKRLKSTDPLFYEFVKSLLDINPNTRLTAKEALNHPWITSE